MRSILVPCTLLAVAPLAAPAPAQSNATVREVIRTLNDQPTVKATDRNKSYRTIFDAYLELGDPPRPIGPEFNLVTIHPGMEGWDAVAGWAEASPELAAAIVACKEKLIFGLPYGRDEVDSAYRQADLVADVAGNGSLKSLEFPYLDAIDEIAAFSTAECYRRFEAGETEPGLDLALSTLFVVRQLCDRDFLEEKMRSTQLLSNMLQNFRDFLYLYQDAMTSDQLREIAWWEIPYLQPDRSRLLMPEADRVVAEALIREVFDEQTGAADPQKFADTFAEIQAEEAPLTRFGAAARWRMIAPVHGSLEASLERLTLIYDDWWRRWRIQEYDPLLDFKTQFERTNPVRYAAVIYSMQDIESLFSVRNQLIAEVNATSLAAGLCAYRLTFGNYPDDIEKTYAQFVRKRSDADPFDREFREFSYRRIDSGSKAVDTLDGRVRIATGEATFWSRGVDHEDDGGVEHRFDGSTDDLIMWPPMRTIQRQQNVID
jgi:hypothetical protein